MLTNNDYSSFQSVVKYIFLVAGAELIYLPTSAEFRKKYKNWLK